MEEKARTFIIAEAGLAHGGDIENAKKLVDMAVEAGCDAIKFQTYESGGFIDDVKAPHWYIRYAAKELDGGLHNELRTFARNSGILYIPTLHNWNFITKWPWMPPIIKLGSGEGGNWNFIKDVARREWTVFASTGMYADGEIDTLVNIFTKENDSNKKLVLLHCVTEYPTPPGNVRLQRIPLLRERYGLPVGYSDHTAGTWCVMAATALGACVIEKHIALENVVVPGQDRVVSVIGVKALKEMVRGIRYVEQACYGTEVSTAQMINRGWARKNPKTGKRPYVGIIPDLD